MATTTAPPTAPPSPLPTATAEPEPGPPGGRLAAVAIVLATVALVAIGLIPPAAVVLSLPFVYLVIRRPVLRRLAVRNASRRPRETLLVILGALLGTAIITSSYVVGDTLRSSIHASAYTQLGPVDEVVLANGPEAGASVQAAIARAHPASTDGTLSLVALEAAVSTTGPLPKAEPRAQVLETNFASARSFGGDASATGIRGPTPMGDQAVVGADLAAELGVEPGRVVRVYAYGTSRTFQVSRVLPRLGIAGLTSFTSFTGSDSLNLFVAPGTVEAMARAGTAGPRASPPLAIVAVSNTGNVTSGVTRTAAVHAELAAAVRGLPAEVQDAKKRLIDAANRAGASFTTLFQTFGYFSVAVGILLLINIFVMLAQERKQSLGMLRAVGMRRGSLVGSFSLEGWIYAVLSALVGTVVGVGIGRLVIAAAGRIFNSGARRAALSLHFSASTRSLQAGFLIGFLIALSTVVLTSLYVARLNVIRAIRDVPEPPHDGRRKSVLIAGTLLTLAGGLLALAGLAASSAIPALAGPALLGAGVIMLSLGRLPTRQVVSVVAVAVLVWSVVCFNVLHHAFDNARVAVFFVQGLVLNVFAVLLVTVNQQSVGSVLRTVGGGSRNMSLRLGLAYPLAKRFRTGLLLAMYAIIVFVLVLLTTVTHFFSSQITDTIHKVGGNASVVVSSNAAEPIPVSDVARLSGVTLVAPTAGTLAEARLVGSTVDFRDYTVVGYDASLIDHGTPLLHSWAPQYRTAEDAYRAALDDPTKVLVGRDFGGSGFGPRGAAPALGDRATVRDPVTGQARQLTIIGLISESSYNGSDHVFISRALSGQLFGSRASSNRLYISTAAGTNNDALATSINGTYIANGADANSFHRLVTREFSAQEEFFTLIEGYVALGLLVGIAGLGVVMVRAVRERRREVGVLRALGFSGTSVRRAFVAESSFIALEGIGIGTVLALITAWRLVNSNVFGTGASFSIPWIPVLLLMAVTFVASLLATAAPAVQASRIRPAVALRMSD